MAIENIDSWGYTAQYEYACSLVKLFLERESKLDKNSEDHVYGVGTIRTLFTADYSMIRNDSVRASITKCLTPDPKSGTSFDVLTRMRNLYMDIVSALGNTFVEQLKNNVVEGLIALGTSQVSYGNNNQPVPKVKELRKIYNTFLTNFPIVTLCILGCKDYALNLLQKRRMTQSLDIVHTSP